MARQKGIIKLEGTLGDVTFVNSSKYRRHARSRRGTYKKATVNEVLKSKADSQDTVTSLGSSILGDLKAVDRGFVPGSFWAAMMRRMMKVKVRSIDALLESIKGLELNERYPFERYFSSLALRLSNSKSKLSVDIEILTKPEFPKEVAANEFLIEVMVLFLDGKGNCIAQRMETEWLSGEESLGVYEMVFLKPKTAKYFLVVEGIKAGKDNEAIESFFARGYKIAGWGKC